MGPRSSSQMRAAAAAITGDARIKTIDAPDYINDPLHEQVGGVSSISLHHDQRFVRKRSDVEPALAHTAHPGGQMDVVARPE